MAKKENTTTNKKDIVPTNKKSRKPTKKKEFSLDNYKKKKGSEDIPQKPLKWLKLSSAVQKATGLPGFPMGYVSLARGFTNTGKSTAISEAVVAAQKAGALPIIINTEGNTNENRLQLMGFDENLPHIFVDNDYLLENFGKKQDAKRNEAAIEDLAECIKDFIYDQERGDLPYDLVFLIDSIGTLDCIRTINAQEKNTSDNNMWNAGAYEKTFKYLLNNTIPGSRKQNKPYTNTFIAVQKIWIDNLGAGVVKHKGGEAIFYGSRLVYHFGGVAAHSTSVVKATSKKREVAYAIDTKVGVAKNHIDGDLGGISLEGKIISTPHGFIFAEDLDNYKKENILYFRNILGDKTITADAIEDKYTKNKAADTDAGINYDEFISKD
jgi:hypothetical protein